MATKQKQPPTWSLRLAACRYAAVLRLDEAGLSSEADVRRAWEDLERAALAHARKARAGMKAILAACVLAIAACGGSAEPSAPRVSGHWTLSIAPNRTAELTMATDASDNPLANAGGTLVVDGQSIALNGHAGTDFGVLFGNVDATHQIEIDLSFVAPYVSGQFCEKQRRAAEPQITDSACAEFSGLPL